MAVLRPWSIGGWLVSPEPASQNSISLVCNNIVMAKSDLTDLLLCIYWEYLNICLSRVIEGKDYAINLTF